MIAKADSKAPKGVKFVEKYKVSTANIYRGCTIALRIPPKGHPLYDETAPTSFDPIMVDEMDRGGSAMTTPIEVWTDPDEGILWILDGRGRWLDVQEVNRRRKERGCELLEPYIVPFRGNEQAAVARVRIKNYHRRIPSVSSTACDLLALRRQGYDFAACAKILHVETEDAEQWGRKLLPLAHCAPAVRRAIDAGDIPRGKAKLFGGTKEDGAKRLGDKAQEKLLAELLEAKRDSVSVKEKPRRPTRKHVDALVAAVSDKAPALADFWRWVCGDVSAFDGRKGWAKLAEVTKPKAGRPKKGDVAEEANEGSEDIEEGEASEE